MDPFIAEIIQVGLVSGTFLTAFALFLFARRRPAPRDDHAVFVQLSDRLQRIEQAVDTIAIEMERVSEGQRFTSKLLAERDQNRSPARQITPH